jgi:hypothetical protein
MTNTHKPRAHHKLIRIRTRYRWLYIERPSWLDRLVPERQRNRHAGGRADRACRRYET